MMQRIVLVMGGAVCLLIAVSAIYLSTQSSERPAPGAALNIADAAIGGPFTLVDQTGRTVSSEEVIDGPTLIYFGYTYCPDVCPVDVQIMVDTVDELAKQDIDATPVFITIDPARDDVETMAIWAEIMHPKMIALTGSDEQVAQAASAYKAYFQKVETDGASDYLMNHSAYIYLVDQSGLRAMYRRGVEPDLLAADVAWALEH
ncbi:SCO family protein [Rhodobacteraceae bacterium NNCM2]|nr:SCO family protein [Coraliihabitans acroporae]